MAVYYESRSMYKEALDAYHRAADAVRRRSAVAEDGHVIRRRAHLKRAVAHAPPRHRQGSIPAQLKLAALYAVGSGGSPFPVEVDTAQSFRCVGVTSLPFPRGHADARSTLCSKSLCRWHLKAAEAGDPEAMFFVGTAYQYEHGCERNYKVRDWFCPRQDAARRGLTRA